VKLRRRDEIEAGQSGVNNTTVLRGDVVREATRLKQQYERDIVVHGSPQLAQTLLEHDLVDELRLLVYPVVVGAGKRLFGETSSKRNLALHESRTFGDGITLLVYRPAAADQISRSRTRTSVTE